LSVDVWSATSKVEKPGLSFSSENTSQKMFIGTDKNSEIVNDSDSDGRSFSELSDSDTCKVNPPFSGGGGGSSSDSEEEKVVQPIPHKGTKRIRRALPKRANTDFDLGWKEQIHSVQKPAFSSVPGINKNCQITQDSSPWDISEIFFSPEMFKLIQKETNRYATQQINKKQEGCLSPKSVFALWHSLTARNKKFFVIIIHMSVLRRSSLRDYWSLHPIMHTPYADSVGMSQDRFLTLLTMFHLNNNHAKADRGQPGYDPLFKMQPVTDTLITKFQDVYTPEEQQPIDVAIYPFRGRIFFCVHIKGKRNKYGTKMFELCEAQSGYIYNLDVYTGAHPTNPEHNTKFSVVDRLCDKIKGEWPLCVHGQIAFKSKDIRQFMGLQNKGCRHSDVQQKRNA